MRQWLATPQWELKGAWGEWRRCSLRSRRKWRKDVDVMTTVQQLHPLIRVSLASTGADLFLSIEIPQSLIPCHPRLIPVQIKMFTKQHLFCKIRYESMYKNPTCRVGGPPMIAPRSESATPEVKMRFNEKEQTDVTFERRYRCDTGTGYQGTLISIDFLEF